jgi:hypothetical protein
MQGARDAAEEPATRRDALIFHEILAAAVCEAASSRLNRAGMLGARDAAPEPATRRDTLICREILAASVREAARSGLAGIRAGRALALPLSAPVYAGRLGGDRTSSVGVATGTDGRTGMLLARYAYRKFAAGGDAVALW